MTQHEAERLAFWAEHNGYRGMITTVKEGPDGLWGVSVNGFDPIYYLWEWPMFLEWWKNKSIR